jgi:hypothetical protein
LKCPPRKALSVAVASIVPKLADALGIPIVTLEGVVDRVPYPMLGGIIDQLHRLARMSPEVREAEMTALEKLIREFGPKK